MFTSVLLTEFIKLHTLCPLNNYCVGLAKYHYFKTRLSGKSERSRSSGRRKMAAIIELIRYFGAYLPKQAWLIFLFDGMNSSWITCYM